MSQKDQILMWGLMRHIQNIIAGISNYSKTSEQQNQTTCLGVSDLFTEFLHEINGLYYKVIIF